MEIEKKLLAKYKNQKSTAKNIEPLLNFLFFNKIKSTLKTFPFIVLILVFYSCETKQKSDSKALARVFDEYLYLEDMKGLVPKGTPAEDSLSITENYINNWAKKKLVLAKATYNLQDIEHDIEKDVADYRSARIIYAYEKELVRQKLNTNIHPREVENYYNLNKKNFELKDYIVKAFYVQLDKKSPKTKSAKKWLKSGKEEDLLDLEDYCHQYASKFILDPEKWIYFEDLRKETGIENLKVDNYLEKGKIEELTDDKYIHLLKINDFKLKDSISPLALEEENIKQIIINQRKLDLIKTMRNDAFQDALGKNNFEIYTNK